MQKRGSAKNAILYVYEILRRYSDAGHPLTRGQIAQRLEAEYGVVCDRKTVSRNVTALREAGVDIDDRTERGRGCFLREPLLRDEDIELLTDSLMAYAHVARPRAQQLAKRLSGLGTVYLHSAPECVRRAEENAPQEVTLKLRLARLAILGGRQISFRPGRKAETPVCFQPLALVPHNGRYYLAGHLTEGRYAEFAAEEIEEMRILPAAGFRKNSRTAEPAEEKTIAACIRMTPMCLDRAAERFGASLTLLGHEGGQALARIEAPLAELCRWILSEGGEAQAEGPLKLREMVRIAAQKLTKCHINQNSRS